MTNIRHGNMNSAWSDRESCRVWVSLGKGPPSSSVEGENLQFRTAKHLPGDRGVMGKGYSG